MRTVDFVPHHLHWKQIRTGSLNVQYEQEERLQQCSHEHLTIVLRQTWKIVNLSFNTALSS